MIGVIVLLMVLQHEPDRSGRLVFRQHGSKARRGSDFFGLSLPWLPVVLLYQLPGPVLPPPGLPPGRCSRPAPSLSKPQAIAAMLTFATLVLGGIWQRGDSEVSRTRHSISW